jgi:hypothetical protein
VGLEQLSATGKIAEFVQRLERLSTPAVMQ